MDSQTFKILAYNLAALEESFAKLARKAKKLGLEAPAFKVLRYIPEFTNRLAVPAETIPAKYEIEVSGEFPKMSGWNFVGTIEHTEHGNVLRAFPNEEISEAYRMAKPTCDHCETQRNRKDTFLVRNEAGELKRVGRACIKDYLGGNSPAQIAYMATLLKEIRLLDEERRTSSGDFGIDTVEYLAFCLACIEFDGYYVSKSKVLDGHPGEATSQKAILNMMKTKDRDFQPSKEQIEEAIKLLDWTRSLEANGSFEANLKIVAQKDLLKSRDLGFIACIPVTHARKLDLLKKREVQEDQRKEQAAISQHFGELKKRAYFDLTYTRSVSFDSEFGRTYIHMFQDSAGNAAIWKTGNSSPVVENGYMEEFKPNQTYRIKATVKDHTEYKGLKQTVLTRATVDPVNTPQQTKEY